jgi:Kef-type K+ transport system membrane component KefB
VHLALGFDAVAALLLASCWASHTLLTYPMFQSAGVVTNRAVSIGVAGTVLTDTVALLVLVALARSNEGELTIALLAVQIPAMAAAAGAVLVGLPWLARRFFAGIGRDRPARFLFVVVALYGSSLLAEAVGVEPIIGAFLAGLAMNRLVVEESELDARIRQFGSTLLIPVFLISVGMLIDPVTALGSGRTLVLAASFTLVVIAGKSLAAAGTARIHRLDNAERATLIALSVPQAAATLAAVFVGFEIGLIGQEVVDAVVMVILVTCLLGTMAARRAIDHLPSAPVRTTPLGKRILVPIGPNALNEPVLELAAVLGRRDSGTIYPFAALDVAATNTEVTALRDHLVATAEQTALTRGCEARSIVRLDLTPAIGLVHASIETNATMILLPWDGERTGRHDRFSHTADTLLDLANTPVLIARIDELDRYRRIILRLDSDDLDGSRHPTAELAWLIGARLAEQLKLPLVLETTAEQPVLDGVAGIARHISHVEHITLDLDAEPRATEDLVVRPLTHEGSRPSTIWVALPRTSPAHDVRPLPTISR